MVCQFIWKDTIPEIILDAKLFSALYEYKAGIFSFCLKGFKHEKC